MALRTDIGQYAIVPLHIAQRLTPSALQVFVWLAGKWADRDTGEAFPSAPLIAETIGISDRTVRRALNELEDCEVIERVPQFGDDGRRLASLIRLKLAQKADTSDRAEADTSDRAHEKGIGLDTDDNPPYPSVSGQGTRAKEPEPEKEVNQESSHSQEPVVPRGRSSNPNQKHSAAEVFDHWILVMHPQRRPKFTRDRRRKIEARLREGYGVTDLKQAIDGCAASDFHMGRDPNNDLRSGGRLFNSIDLICRNGEHVDRFMEMAPSLLRPDRAAILETRSVMTPDEIADAEEVGAFPYDEASVAALAEVGP